MAGRQAGDMSDHKHWRTVLIRELEAAIREHDDASAHLRASLELVRARRLPATPHVGAKLRIADGSLESRILGLTDPDAVAMPVLLKEANAKPYDVRRAVKRLVVAGRLVQHGKSKHTRYQAQ